MLEPVKLSHYEEMEQREEEELKTPSRSPHQSAVSNEFESNFDFEGDLMVALKST